MRRFVVLVLVIVLAACAQRGELTIYPEAAARGGAEIRSVFVGTTRKLVAETRMFDGARSETLTLARYDVSIPPAHELGKIEWPPRRGRVDPQKHFVTTGDMIYGTDGQFRQDLAAALRANGGDATIFVHGFNNTFSEGLYRIAQLSHDLKLPGVAMHYAWPSIAKPLGYVTDRDSSLFARDGLDQLLRETERAGAKRIYLVAHSMGSALTMESLRQIALSGDRQLMDRIAGVILISPDLDVDLFRSLARGVGRLPQPFIIFGSPKDRVLQLSARLTGQPDRLGTVSDVSRLSDLKVTYLDIEAFTSGGGHFEVGNNPALIQLLARIVDVDASLGADMNRVGLLDGAVLTVQNATQIVLAPVTIVADGLSR